MKKTVLFTLLFVAVSIISGVAQVKVAYITFVKTMDAAASTVQNDPIIRMLSGDANLTVTVKALTSVLATDVISDLSSFDVIIVQESFSGSAGMLMPSGALALKSIPKPCLYNKSYAFKSGRALTTSSAAGGKESNKSLAIKVQSTALSNDLFKGCTFVGDSIKCFNAYAADLGSTTTGAVKALNYSDGNAVTDASSTAISTLLAVPSSNLTTPAISFNDIPAGSKIDSETTGARIITVGMNFGAICANGGTNITSDGLTIWRNAVYMLAGLTVPSSKATLPTGLINTPSSDLKVVSQQFYTINGRLVTTPNNGIYLKKSVYDNGTIKYDKVAFIESLQK